MVVSCTTPSPPHLVDMTDLYNTRLPCQTNREQTPTSTTEGQFHVTTDTTQKNKSSYAEYLVLVLYCTHITCHGFKGNMQIQLNNSEIFSLAQLCEKL